MNLRLLTNQDRVLVRVDVDPVDRLDPGDVPSVIEIPEAHRRFSRCGVVLAVGNGRWVRQGDRVLLPLSADGMSVYQIGGREHRILRESQLLGVIE